MGDHRSNNKKVSRTSEYRSGEEDTEENIMGRARHGDTPGDSGAKEQKRKRPVKERWLLTRKTWRYMADAGRRLIPDGAHNRPEDIPKIESYFQQVCHREPRFLLWRKSSYPGALGFRSHNRKNRSRKKGGSYKEKASSADEADTFVATPTGSGRFDLHRLRQEFLYGPSTSGSGATHRQKTFPDQKSRLPGVPEKTYRQEEEEDEEEKDERELLETLTKYLGGHMGTQQEAEEAASNIDFQKLVDQLRRYLSKNQISEDDNDTTDGRGESSLHASRTTLRTTTQRPLTPSPPTSSSAFDFDSQERMTLETLRRYYSKSTCRQKVITDLLTNRKLLEKLHFDLRQARGFKLGTKGGRYPTSSRSQLDEYPKLRTTHRTSYKEERDKRKEEDSGNQTDKFSLNYEWNIPPLSPPPLIEIQPDEEIEFVDSGTQTEQVSASLLTAIEEELKKQKDTAAQETKQESRLEVRGSTSRRRSSVDNDDVSPSVSDTIKRYLRMARKKSLDADKVDRFKRVNYDRNLRNIKPKGEITLPGDDDGLNKGSQSDESWVSALKELKLEDVSSDPEISPGGDEFSGSRVTSSRSSLDGAGISDDALLSPPPVHAGVKQNPHHSILSSGQTFLSNLLHGLQHHQQQQNTDATGVTQSSASAVTSVGGTMQKSKSSSSVVQHGSRLVSKKIWRGRSKSQSRASTSPTSSWTPQGNCTWTNMTGHQVTLTDTSLLSLSEVERRVLQKVAVAKLQALNLGVTVRIPSETVVPVSHKPKRRPYLLKRKALTTGFFDTARGKDEKDKDTGGGLVFGIPISQCLENDRISRLQRGGSPSREEPSELRRDPHHGSRTSCTSLIETSVRGDEHGTLEEEEDPLSGSCESLMSPGERMAGSVPGLLDALSCGSTMEFATASSGQQEPHIPQLVQVCFQHLENFGLHTLGIFRVSSSKKRVRQLREEFDCGKDIVLGEDHCPHDVATLLKEFFRDLPEPLLCRDLYHAFVQTQKIRNRRLQYEALQHLIQLLPVPNRDTLWALLNFLVIVAHNSDDKKSEYGETVLGSKMDSNNLATVFAPNILHCIKPGSSKELSSERAEERIDVINVIRCMIDRNQELFQIPAELLDEVYLHMMDSHPEALDRLLRKRGNIGDELPDELQVSTSEIGRSEMSSVPRTPAQLSSEVPDQGVSFSEIDDQSQSVRRVWSREEFLHETAGMGGPDISMRPRHKEYDHGSQRSSKKRWKEEYISRRKGDSDGVQAANSIATSASASQISVASQQKSSMSSRVQYDGATKMRSASVDCSQNVFVDRTQEVDTQDSDHRSSGGGGVITASLKIPVPSALNLDDSDIPFIEEAGGGISLESGRQQMTIGVVRRPASGDTVRRRRQHSASGSDSSQASASLQPSSMSTQQGCDSAVGSSATFSSPPHNTTPSICSSDAGLFSSPPSWASSPPTSPDALTTAVSFMPEELTSRIQQQHMQIGRLSVETSTTQQPLVAQKVVKETAPVILQKVSFTSTSELHQVQRGDTTLEKQEVHSSKTTTQKKALVSTGDLSKSASTSAVMSSLKKSLETEPSVSSECKYTTSISSIGGAVMKSKTADIERMLRIKGDSTKVKSVPTASQPQQTTVQEDKKKYTKRSYTDSRHQTRHIPDSESLQGAATARAAGSDTSTVTRQRKSPQGPVWKRRELIASEPKVHEKK